MSREEIEMKETIFRSSDIFFHLSNLSSSPAFFVFSSLGAEVCWREANLDSSKL
jgi:hypothetical protein